MNSPRAGIPQIRKNTAITAEDLNWQQHAHCRGHNTAIFFPSKGDEHSARPAKNRFCIDCQVRADCLRYALVHNEIHGVWGGLSETQRRALMRRRELETT